jgi:integrase
MSRRGRNEGSIRKRSDGRWEARAVVTDPSGARVRRSFLGRDRAAVRDRMQEALRAESNGISMAPEKVTVEAFLASWLETTKPSIRPRTYQSYELQVRVHLSPGLGHLPLTRLSPQQVQQFLNAKAAAGLSPRSVAIIRAVLRLALRQAERWGMVSRNVATLVAAPRVIRREIRPLDPDQARRLLEVIDGDPYEALYVTALAVGLRQGELLGLAWSDVDLDAGTLRVRNALQRVDGDLRLVEPKSATSHRLVALPAVVVTALRAHRIHQLEDRLAAGARWGSDAWGLVFLTSVGTPMDGHRVTRQFQELLERYGLPRQRFHDLRHACASLMLAQGVAPRVVMETLGHSQISLTLNTYSHVAPFLGRDAAERMDTILAARSNPDALGAGG